MEGLLPIQAALSISMEPLRPSLVLQARRLIILSFPSVE